MLQAGGRVRVVRRKKDERVTVCSYRGIGQAGEAVAGGVGGKMVFEKLLLGVTDIGGEEDVMRVGP